MSADPPLPLLDERDPLAAKVQAGEQEQGRRRGRLRTGHHKVSFDTFKSVFVSFVTSSCFLFQMLGDQRDGGDVSAVRLPGHPGR